MDSSEYVFSRNLVIIGCGGHSKVVTDIAEAVGFYNISYLGSKRDVNSFFGKEVSSKDPKDYQDYFIVAVGDNSLRERLFREFRLNNPGAIPISLVHPSSIISPRCTIGAGTVIMPLCAVNSSAIIGQGVIVNTRSSIDHDSDLMDFSSVAPGVSMGGNVSIGERSAICIGATIRHNVSIGKDSVVGAGSLVLNDIDDCSVVYGVPASLVRKRSRGEQYL